ncbi:UDP-glucose 4-epimerase family protein [Rheinheimera sp. NSM]|uniref:UDP-glucose 4-epimerase family protein n=1 Tax=Rheinheimera sp. NSM TaxID=3457884 RepID=UPI0040351FA8
MTIMLTGANGFVGQFLTELLLKNGSEIAAVVRHANALNISEAVTVHRVSNFDSAQLSKLDFKGVDCLIHLAARAHILSDSCAESRAEFRKVNRDATLALARLAADAGVGRFIFLSSIGVHGIESAEPFQVTDTPAPVEDYAVSKLEAEIGLRKIATDTGMEVVIIRPPLVYGANAPGNFGKLLNLARKNLPLPLGAIHNKRSLVALDNLVDLIVTCIDHPKAANQIFLVSDDQDVSTTELLQMMTRAAGKTPWLMPVPVSWLKLAAKLTGKQAVIDRLCGNLQVDISHTKETLGWVPPVTVEEGIARCFAAKG